MIPAWKPEDTANAHRILTVELYQGTNVARYCAAFAASKREPLAFARFALAFAPHLCARILDVIGHHPSSEPELAALQRCAP